MKKNKQYLRLFELGIEVSVIPFLYYYLISVELGLAVGVITVLLVLLPIIYINRSRFFENKTKKVEKVLLLVLATTALSFVGSFWWINEIPTNNSWTAIFHVVYGIEKVLLLMLLVALWKMRQKIINVN